MRLRLTVSVLILSLLVHGALVRAEDDEHQIEKKICLLVGIDEYKAPQFHSKRLNGCVNDVEAIAVELAKFGFPGKDDSGFQILRNEDATRDRILNAFDSTVNAADENTLVYIHFSCHGIQVPDENGDENDGDGYDEALIPHDYKTILNGEAILPIIDDEVYEKLLKPLIDVKNAYVVVVFDSCHSGDVERDPFSQARYLGSKAPEVDGSSMLDVELDAVVITACESKQLARERQVMHNNKTETMGVLTSNWAKALKEVSENWESQTYRSIVEGIQGDLIRSGSKQRPLVKGKRSDVVIFSSRDGEPDPYVNAIRTDATVVKLHGGDALGMTKESVFSLYDKDATEFDGENRICNVKIFNVRSLEALAAVDGPLRDGLSVLPNTSFRAVEKAHIYGEQRFKILVDQSAVDNPIAVECRKLLEEKKQIQVVDSKDGTTFLRIIQFGGGLFSQRDTGAKFGPFESAEKLEDHILKWCRFQRILHLENSVADAKTSVDLLIEYEQPLVGRTIGDVFEDEAIEIGFRLRAPVPMYYAILDLKESGKIEPLFVSSNPVDPGVHKPFAPNKPEALPQGVLERRSTLKIICSYHPLPFRYLSQQEIDRGEILETHKGPETDPLSLLLMDNLELTKNHPRLIPKTSWVTDNKTTIVRKRSNNTKN